MDLYTLIYSLALYSLIYFCRLLYTLIHSLLYYTAPHILHHFYILSYTPIICPLYIPIIIYSFIYSLLSYILSFSNGIINLAPPFYTSLLSLIYLPLLYPSTPHIVIPTLLYGKGITTLPPIFTRFTSLS